MMSTNRRSLARRAAGLIVAAASATMVLAIAGGRADARPLCDVYRHGYPIIVGTANPGDPRCDWARERPQLGDDW